MLQSSSHPFPSAITLLHPDKFYQFGDRPLEDGERDDSDEIFRSLHPRSIYGQTPIGKITWIDGSSEFAVLK